MSSITPNMVKELREKTGAGMMDCRNALAESNGNMEGAADVLRKKGISTAAKKAGRTAADGLIGATLSADAKLAALVEVNCETDFVTKTDDFKGFVQSVTDLVQKQNPKDLDALLEMKIGPSSLKEVQTALIAKIGENIGVRRFSRIGAGVGQKLPQYIHAGSKIGVVVLFEDKSGKLDTTTAREVAMHAAAMHPQFTNRREVPEGIIAKEKEIMLAQMGEMKKPPEVMEKILSGKIGKFFTEVCFEDQLYVRDPEGKSTVGAWLKKIEPSIAIKSFVRLQVDEGVEKKA